MVHEQTHWLMLMPSIDLVVGTPVQFRPDEEAPGFPLREGKTMTVRWWGDDREDGWVMIIDEGGTSLPVPEDTLVTDLDHPLGFAHALSVLLRDPIEALPYSFYPPAPTPKSWLLIRRHLLRETTWEDKLFVSGELKRRTHGEV